MKGMIFTEFLEMVEETFSLEMIDKIIENAALPSGGAYTAVGTYHHSEMVQLVTNLSQETGIAIPTLLQSFGERLFQSFAVKYAHFLEHAPSAFDFLEQLESYVHAEVKKLYPEAELPSFECARCAEHEMTMLYRSHRSLGDVAHGLIIGCFRYFEEDVQIRREDASNGRGTMERFTLTATKKLPVGKGMEKGMEEAISPTQPMVTPTLEAY
ncbi:MAG: heme NO-binding domain-containing protein [Caldilineaceae bacterium]|nr:heme NO-binding domain-containing protein [Caldilineaceae bacterium]